jgi:hypothetical protein
LIHVFIVASATLLLRDPYGRAFGFMPNSFIAQLRQKSPKPLDNPLPYPA